VWKRVPGWREPHDLPCRFPIEEEIRAPRRMPESCAAAVAKPQTRAILPVRSGFRGNEIGDQTLTAVFGSRDYASLLYATVVLENGFDFTRLDSMTENLHLAVRTAENSMVPSGASEPDRRCGTCADAVRRRTGRLETWPWLRRDRLGSRVRRRRPQRTTLGFTWCYRIRILIKNINPGVRDRLPIGIESEKESPACML